MEGRGEGGRGCLVRESRAWLQCCHREPQAAAREGVGGGGGGGAVRLVHSDSTN